MEKNSPYPVSPEGRGNRGWLAVITTSLAAMAVFLATGFAFRNLLIEEWHLYKLRMGSEAEKRCAVAKLGELRSVKAAPLLIDLIHRSYNPEWPQRYLFAFHRECSLQRSSRINQIYERWPDSLERQAVLALLAIGKPAAARLEEACSIWDDGHLLRLAALLGLAAGEKGFSLIVTRECSGAFFPVLEKLSKNPDPQIYGLASWAIQQFYANG